MINVYNKLENQLLTTIQGIQFKHLVALLQTVQFLGGEPSFFLGQDNEPNRVFRTFSAAFNDDQNNDDDSNNGLDDIDGPKLKVHKTSEPVLRN